MAICVGCGLSVNANGVLELDVCPTGGIQCATAAVPGPDGCTDGLYVKFPANNTSPIFPPNPDPYNPVNKPAQLGCGITTDPTGKITVDTCLSSGLLCGTTTNDSDCLFANVQNQGPVDITYATATDATNLKPNDCNGLVRTEQGLWSPPKVAHAAQITSFTDIGAHLYDTSFSKLAEDSDFQSFYIGADEWVLGQIGALILCFCFCNTSCNDFEGMTFSKAVTPSVAVDQDQTLRFTLHERLAYRPDCNVNASSGGIGPGLKGVPWTPQSSISFDEMNIYGTGKHTTYQGTLSDYSWIVGPPGSCLRGEMILTYQRFGNGVSKGPGNTTIPSFGPNGAPGNEVAGAFAALREYFFWVTTAHSYLPGDNTPCHINVP